MQTKNKYLLGCGISEGSIWGNRNFNDTYPYTFIAYEHSKRKYLEARSEKEIDELIESQRAGEFSCHQIILPNGKVVELDEFIERYNQFKEDN